MFSFLSDFALNRMPTLSFEGRTIAVETGLPKKAVLRIAEGLAAAAQVAAQTSCNG